MTTLARKEKPAAPQSIADIVNLVRFPLDNNELRTQCKQTLDNNGALVLTNFLTSAAVLAIQSESAANQHLAYYTVEKHNVYLKPSDLAYPNTHPRNRKVSTSKGCITTDQILYNSALRRLHAAPEFRQFLCAVLNEDALYEYADPLSSINLHYASAGQELGWHFDNSSFAITLLIQRPDSGGTFEYVKDVRDADRGEMSYSLTQKILDGEVQSQSLKMESGTLVLFRGRNSLHRVTPVEGDLTRTLAVLAYNTEPGISLSESARITFFGRLE